jgi:hypothetical protein
MQVLVTDERGIAAHGAVVQRRVRYRKRWLRAGYVEAVGVRPDLRRRGLGGAVMTELERITDAACDLGALSASDEGAGLYAAGAGCSGPAASAASAPAAWCGCAARRAAPSCAPRPRAPSTRSTSWSSTGGTATCSDVRRRTGLGQVGDRHPGG